MIRRLLVLSAVLGALAAPAPAHASPEDSFADAVLATRPLAYWGLGDSGAFARDYAGPFTAGFSSSVQRGAEGVPIAGTIDPSGARLEWGSGISAPLTQGWWVGRTPFAANVWVKWSGDRLGVPAGTYIQGLLGNVNYAFQFGGWSVDLHPDPTTGGAKVYFVRTNWGGSTAVLADQQLQQDRWTMLTFTYDGSTLRVYFDGQPAGEAPSTHSVSNGYNSFLIGHQDYNRVFSGYVGHFRGTMDELALWGRALTPAEIGTLAAFEPPRPRDPSGAGRPALLFVPGIGGSILKKDDLTLWPSVVEFEDRIKYLAVKPIGTESVYDVRATRVLGEQFLDPAYRHAYVTFDEWDRDFGLVDFVPFPYDFRLGMENEAARLALELQKICESKDIWIVAHSTGGVLVKAALRWFRETGTAIDKCFDTTGVVMIAVPHVGSPKAIGTIINPDLFFAKLLRWRADEKEFARVINNWLSAWQLMPRRGNALNGPRAREPWFDIPNDGLGDKNRRGDPLNWQLDREADNQHPRHYSAASTLGGIRFYNVFGYGLDTPYSYAPGGCGKLIDGEREIKNRETDAHLDAVGNGDTTVPSWSAMWPGIAPERQYALTGVKHMDIPSDPAVLRLIGLMITAPAKRPEWPTQVDGSSARGLVRGSEAVAAARDEERFPWRTTSCSPVALLARAGGKETGMRADGTLVDEIPNLLAEVQDADDGPRQTFVFPSEGAAAPPVYEIVAIGDGPVTIENDAPDGSRHDFMFTVREGDRAKMEMGARDWELALDRGGDGDVDETLVANHPVVSVAPAGPVDEGSEVELSATADSQTGEPLTLSWTVVSGGGSVSGDGGRAAYRAEDGPATAVVRVTAADPRGRSAGADVEVEVRNVAPTASAGPDATTPWGLPVAFAAAATDPSALDTAAGFGASWSFGALTLLTSQTWAAPGQYEAALTVTDKDGGAGSDAALVTVTRRDAALAIATPGRLAYGDRTLAATMTDPLPGGRLDRVLRFTLDGVEHPATADTSGRATVALVLPPAPGAHRLAVALADDPLYTAAPIERELVVESTPGQASGTLTLASGARLTLGVSSGGASVQGELHWRPASGDEPRIAELTALGVHGTEVWIGGKTADGRDVVVHASEQRVDVWVAGELHGDSGPVERGNLQARRR